MSHQLHGKELLGVLISKIDEYLESNVKLSDGQGFLVDACIHYHKNTDYQFNYPDDYKTRTPSTNWESRKDFDALFNFGKGSFKLGCKYLNVDIRRDVKNKRTRSAELKRWYEKYKIECLHETHFNNYPKLFNELWDILKDAPDLG